MPPQPVFGFGDGSADGEGGRRTPREAALDRIHEARVQLDRKSTWLKRGSVFGVVATVGFGALQGWPWLSFLAIPVALGLWWLDAGVNREDERLQRLYDAVSARTTEPPVMGAEAMAAAGLPDPPGALRKSLLSGPGAGLHFMMTAIAIGASFFF